MYLPLPYLEMYLNFMVIYNSKTTTRLPVNYVYFINTCNTKKLHSFPMYSIAALVNASAQATDGELQYLVNQTNCLKKIGPHANIIEIFLFHQTGNVLFY